MSSRQPAGVSIRAAALGGAASLEKLADRALQPIRSGPAGLLNSAAKKQAFGLCKVCPPALSLRSFTIRIRHEFRTHGRAEGHTGSGAALCDRAARSLCRGGGGERGLF